MGRSIADDCPGRGGAEGRKGNLITGLRGDSFRTNFITKRLGKGKVGFLEKNGSVWE